MSRYAEIAITNYAKVLDRTFTYRIPKEYEDIVQIGSKVIVSFGRGNKPYDGFVLKLLKKTELKNVKDILEVLDKSEMLTKNQLQLITFMRNRYLASYSEIISLITPPKDKLKFRIYYTVDPSVYKIDSKEKKFYNIKKIVDKGEILEQEINKMFSKEEIKFLLENNFLIKHYKIVSSNKVDTDFLISLNENLEDILLKLGKRSKKKIKILELINKRKKIFLSEIRKEFSLSKRELNDLEDNGYVIIKEVKVDKKIDLSLEGRSRKFNLNKNQLKIYNEIFLKINEKIFCVHLIHGITGSGKTEIYIELVKRTLEQGNTAFVLVPEISLTPQLISRFHVHFGEKIAVFHSKLSNKLRYEQWLEVKNGNKKIVIGARSAIFAPLQNIGLIILDEEHDLSYKSNSNIRYHARDIAFYLAMKEKAVVVLGSATPSIESYYNAISGKFTLNKLLERHGNAKLPKVNMVDMREELIEGNRSIFSRVLKNKIIDRLNRKEQIIILLNRKGHSTYVSCRECGFTLKCPHCEISLTYYKSSNSAKCSYCDYEVSVTPTCPSCNSKYYKYFGMGTEKLEEIVKEEFIGSKVERLDSTIVSKKGNLEKVLKKLENREVDILVGTQIISKGLDFSNITLVGIINADSGLNIPDYTANESTFQIINQVSGRAGRGEKEGEVIIQTYDPNNFVLKSAKEHDYMTFYNEEMKLRNFFEYPPFYKICSLMFNSELEKDVKYISSGIKRQIEELIIKNKLNNVDIIGPNPAIYSKIRGRYRYQIIVKYKFEDTKVFRNVIRIVKNNYDKNIRSKYSDVKFIIDIDAKSLI